MLGFKISLILCNFFYIMRAFCTKPFSPFFQRILSGIKHTCRSNNIAFKNPQSYLNKIENDLNTIDNCVS